MNDSTSSFWREPESLDLSDRGRMNYYGLTPTNSPRLKHDEQQDDDNVSGRCCVTALKEYIGSLVLPIHYHSSRRKEYLRRNMPNSLGVQFR